MYDNQYLSRLTSDLLQIFIRDQPLTSFNALLKLRISSRGFERFHFDVETYFKFYPFVHNLLLTRIYTPMPTKQQEQFGVVTHHRHLTKLRA